MAAGAIAAIGGAVAQPIASHFGQKRQHKYIKEYMKNKHQWEVADLIAAGLNPILGYTKGGPGIGSPGIPSIAGGMGTTALSAAKLREELELLRASSDKLRAEAGKARIQTKKVDIEVKEFPPTLGGVARRVLESVDWKKGAKRFLNAVGDVPDWIRKSVMNAAER